jgi:16S rRNA (guanine1207-N2)-methyltransferase
VGLANRNARLNRVENAQALCGEGFAPLPAGEYDLVLTNPPIRAGKEVVYGLFSAARDRLSPGGRLVAVIRTNQGAKSAEEFLKGEYESVRELERESGYRLLEATKG